MIKCPTNYSMTVSQMAKTAITVKNSPVVYLMGTIHEMLQVLWHVKRLFISGEK